MHQALAGLDAQVQLRRPVTAIDTLVVPVEASEVAQVQEAQPNAPVALVVSQA